jgi:hypothetical protein
MTQQGKGRDNAQQGMISIQGRRWQIVHVASVPRQNATDGCLAAQAPVKHTTLLHEHTTHRSHFMSGTGCRDVRGSCTDGW